jgi:hypothetical protein
LKAARDLRTAKRSPLAIRSGASVRRQGVSKS